MTHEEALKEAIDHINRLVVALKPFTDFATNVGYDPELDTVAWGSSIHRESISTWFGPKDFAYALFAVNDTSSRLPSLSAPPAPARDEEIERLTEERGDEGLFRTVLTEYQICQPALIDVLVPTGYEWGACQTFMDRYDLMKRRVRLMFEVYRVASGQSDGGPHGGLLAETIGSVDLNPLALESLKKHQRPLDIDGDEVGVSRQALHELLASYTFLIVERDSKKDRGA